MPEYGVSALFMNLAIFTDYPRRPSAERLASIFMSTGIAFRSTF